LGLVAFSELRFDIQQAHFDKAVKKSRNGYITYNDINTFSSFKLDDYQRAIDHLEVNDEKIISFEGNMVLTWQEQSAQNIIRV
jgi:hypothetical protein